KLQIPLKLIRRADFNSNLKLKAAGISALDKLKEIEVDGKATNATIELDLTQYRIPPGTYSFYLQTQTPGKYRNNPEAAKAAEEKLAAAKAALEKKPDEKELLAAKEAAAKTAEETESKSKAALEGKLAGEKAAAEAKAKAKKDAEAQKAAEQAEAEAPGKLKD